MAGPLERADHAVDTVTRITVDAANVPSMQSFDDEITCFSFYDSADAGSDAFFSIRPCCLSSAQKSDGIFACSEFQSS